MPGSCSSAGYRRPGPRAWRRRGRGATTGPSASSIYSSLGGAALAGVERFERLEALYWLHQSRRDLVLQSPGSNGEVHGTFSLRSPVRPNPIGTSIVALEKIKGNRLFVRGLDCLDGAAD